MKKIALFLMAAIAVISCKPEEEAIVPEVTVNTAEETLVIPTAGGEAVISFTTNVDWTANIAETVDWCTLTPSTGKAGEVTVKLIAQKNETNDNRIATVVITAQDVVKQVKVTQLQKNALVLSGESAFEVPAEGGEVKFTVSANVTLTATPDVDWIVATKAMQNTEYSFTVAANDGAARSGKIVVTDGKLTEEVTVSQAAWVPVFEVSPAEDQWLAVAGGTVELNVNANVEYEVTMDENDWLTLAGENGAYTLTAGENPAFDYRAVGVYVTPKDEAFVDSAVAFYVFQNGHAAKLWAVHPAEDFKEYDASQKVRLAAYGDKLLVSNSTKIYVVDSATGSLENTISMPEGVSVQSLVVDDAGNILVAADAGYGVDFTVYTIPDITNPVPETYLTYNTGNYYGVDTGNLRVKGNIKENAVITATVSDGAGGAVLFWEVVGGECSTWYWTSVPYAGSEVTYACAAPAGNTLADGLFYIGYGGDYNLRYAASVTKDAASEWAVSYVTGSSWMENYNCISTAEWNGTKYAATVMGCHFDYDAADALLLNVNNPAAAELVYRHYGDGDVAWDWAAGVNPSWTGLGVYSDVLLVPTEDALLMVYVDSNYGAMACVAIQ